jgi:hypothetical protein
VFEAGVKALASPLHFGRMPVAPWPPRATPGPPPNVLTDKRAATEPTQFLIDLSAPEGQSSGLSQPSSVKCENLYTVSQKTAAKTLGHLSDPLKKKLEDCLKAALELP